MYVKSKSFVFEFLALFVMIRLGIFLLNDNFSFLCVTSNNKLYPFIYQCIRLTPVVMAVNNLYEMFFCWLGIAFVIYIFLKNLAQNLKIIYFGAGSSKLGHLAESVSSKNFLQGGFSRKGK